MFSDFLPKLPNAGALTFRTFPKVSCIGVTTFRMFPKVPNTRVMTFGNVRKLQAEVQQTFGKFCQTSNPAMQSLMTLSKSKTILLIDNFRS